MIVGLVSTIIPVYNRPALLKEAVQSVLNQTYRPIEIIIVDDGSTDDTGKMADLLASERPEEIRVIYQKNTGPGLAREAGRLVARGEFIQYLDSDDILLPVKFEHQVAGLRTHPECDVSYGWTRFRHSNSAVEGLPWKGSGSKVETMFPSFLRSRWWDTSTPLYRQSVCEKTGPWTALSLEEDWEYDCRVAALGVRLHYCNEYVAEIRDHGECRLCQGEALNPQRLSERAKAHTLIFSHALRAGISENTPEMRHFARELFLLARQSGAAGLAKESEELFSLSKKASGEERGNGWDFRTYEFAAKIVGWPLLGRVACRFDGLRR
jgi:glycosyltransferase involved in cell wall biosynthesis